MKDEPTGPDEVGNLKSVRVLKHHEKVSFDLLLVIVSVVKNIAHWIPTKERVAMKPIEGANDPWVGHLLFRQLPCLYTHSHVLDEVQTDQVLLLCLQGWNGAMG